MPLLKETPHKLGSKNYNSELYLHLLLEDEETSSNGGEDEEGVGPDGLAHAGERHAHQEVTAPVGQRAPRHARRPRTHLEYLCKFNINIKNVAILVFIYL